MCESSTKQKLTKSSRSQKRCSTRLLRCWWLGKVLHCRQCKYSNYARPGQEPFLRCADTSNQRFPRRRQSSAFHKHVRNSECFHFCTRYSSDQHTADSPMRSWRISLRRQTADRLARPTEHQESGRGLYDSSASPTRGISCSNEYGKNHEQPLQDSNTEWQIPLPTSRLRLACRRDSPGEARLDCRHAANGPQLVFQACGVGH
jgi:hypothetical protein